MPRPAFPLTPGSSSDIKARDGAQQLSSLHLSFELPPPAIHDALRSSPSDARLACPAHHALYPPSMTASPSAAYPMQAAETVKSRRRSFATREPKDKSFSLPPPPTRSRKIIQMKPRPQDEAAENASARESGKSGAKAAANAAKAAASSASGVDKGRKKQPSATSAAGRKIARKTAHSLIERRRRSKMNEEFSVLKGMIPACTGEMHKLAILQASIDYVRYLEDCVVKLKAQHDAAQSRGESAHNPLPPIREFHPTFHEDPAGHADMTDSDAASPRLVGNVDNAHQSCISPLLQGQDSGHGQHANLSIPTDHGHYNFSASAGTSPAFGPRRHDDYARGNVSASESTLTSPALNPQSDLDHEATTALLMLNNDRRCTNASGRGLSVRDLLST